MAVGLQLAGKNDFVRVQEDINDNLTKLDEAIDFNLLATLGIEYGGILNNTEAKVAGKAYYDTTGKKLYKCIANTSINYADAGYFEALSNNDLLGRLNNLHVNRFQVFYAGPAIPAEKLITGTQTDGVLKLDLSGVPSSYTIVSYECVCDTSENNNFTYGSVAGYSLDTFRFTRLDSGKGFSVYAYAIRLK